MGHKRSKPTRVNRKSFKKPKMTKAAPKVLPVTLLSGFLGSGKTTLLQHILRSNHGLRIAVVVNDIGAINIDASLIKQTHRVTKTDEKVIALQNGCICCTLRGDLLEELVRLSKLQQFDYVIIESSGISEPEQVAETFDERLAEKMEAMGGVDGDGLDEETLKVLKQIIDAGGVSKFAKLDTTVTVIDCFTMLNDFDTADLLSARRDDVTEEDERNVSNLMVDQIEFADVIVLNKTDMVDAETKGRVVSLIKQLNHDAKLLESTYGKVDVKELVNTGKFDLEKAQVGAGWLQDLHDMTLREVNGKNRVTPKPETDEYNVRNFVYVRHRPFHPQRLWQLIYDKFIAILEHPDDDEDDEDEEGDEDDGDQDEEMTDLPKSDATDDEEMPPVDEDSSSSRGKSSIPSSPQSTQSTVQTVPSPSKSKQDARQLRDVDNEEEDYDGFAAPPNEVILENKRKHPLFARLFRSKGGFFLATRPHLSGDWSQAGALLTLTGSTPWLCTLPEEEYLNGSEEMNKLILDDIAKGGEWGDRRQELVFIGEKLDHEGIEEILDKCLLNDEEWDQWQDIMRDEGVSDEQKREALEEVFDDGFPDWPAYDDHDHEGHDHGKASHKISDYIDPRA